MRCHISFASLQSKPSLQVPAYIRQSHKLHRLRVPPVNVAAGSRPTPQIPQPPSPPPSQRSKAAKITTTSSSSLPIALAGLSCGLLLGAAALHFDGQDHATIVSAAASAVTPLKEFGPADLLAQGFGPTKPLLPLLQSQQTAAAAQHAVSASLNKPLATAETFQGARHVADGAVSAVRGAIDQTCDGYNRWLQESPLMCKIVTGNFFTIAGDMLAQLGLGSGGGHGDVGDAGAAKAGRRKFNILRTTRLCLETSAVGTPLGHWWFGLLDSTIMPENPHCPTAVLTKMLADQVLFAPLGLLMFFAIIKCLEGRPRDIPQTLRTSYLKALLGGYLLWPAAGILNFALLPNEYRLLFNNCVNILWTCFLSIMSSGDDQPAENTSACSSSAAESTHGSTSHAGIDAALEVAILVAALSAAESIGRPTCGYVAGMAVAAIEAALISTHGSETVSAQQEAVPIPVSSQVAVPFGAGASVALGSPCLELYEQPEDARLAA